MKPILSSVFSFFEGTPQGKKRIEKIELSKQHKAMRLVLCEEIPEKDAEFIKDILKEKMGITSVEVTFLKEKEEKFIPEEEIYIPQKKESVISKKQDKKDLGKAEANGIIIGQEIRAGLMPISEIAENSGKEMFLVTLDVTDFTDSITVKTFVTDKEKYDIIQKAFSKVNKNVEKYGLKAGERVVIRGTAKYDDFANEVVVNARDINYAMPETQREDNAEKKRVELHLHTQMSQMDAVSSASSLIERAVAWGHTAIAITDHGVVQSYPELIRFTNLDDGRCMDSPPPFQLHADFLEKNPDFMLKLEAAGQDSEKIAAEYRQAFGQA